MTLYYTDPELSTVPLKSRTISGEHIVAHDIDALPAADSGNIAASRGFLETLAGALAAGPASANVTVVASSVSSVTLAAANAARVGVLIVNNSTSKLYVKFGTAASTTSWSVPIEAGGYWEMPPRYYAGIITGAWATANGAAHVTAT